MQTLTYAEVNNSFVFCWRMVLSHWPDVFSFAFRIEIWVLGKQLDHIREAVYVF